jgi:branched-chain amino acid transport system substrate-binding protein
MRTRRLTVAMVVMLLGAAAALPPPGGPALAQTKAPLKVGLLFPYTGVFALYGPGMQAALEAFFEQHRNRVAGRPVQLVREDTEGKPDVGLTKARKLVESDRVHFMVGPVSSAVAMAVRDYVHGKKVPLIVPIAFTKDLTTPEKWSPYIFRTIDTTDQQGYPFGRWAVTRKGFKRVVVIGSNYAAGRDGVGAFKAGVEDAGGKVVDELFPPLGTQDFAPFLSRINPAQVDAAYAVVFGSDAVRLVKQWQEVGLGKVPLLTYGTSTDDFLMEAMGRSAEGILNVSMYALALDIPENQKFVEAIRAKTGQPAVIFHATAWIAGQMIVKAAESLKGDLDDPERVAKALKAAGEGLRTPVGEIRFDDYNQIVPPLYVRQVQNVQGKYRNVVVDRLPLTAPADVWKWWRK